MDDRHKYPNWLQLEKHEDYDIGYVTYIGNRCVRITKFGDQWRVSCDSIGLKNDLLMVLIPELSSVKNAALLAVSHRVFSLIRDHTLVLQAILDGKFLVDESVVPALSSG